MQAWLILGLAGLAEIGWVVGLKCSAGFTRPIPSALTLAALTASMLLLGWATRALPIGTAYAVWTGIGTAGTFLIGILAFNDSTSMMRILSFLLIVVGLIGLRISGQS